MQVSNCIPVLGNRNTSTLEPHMATRSTRTTNYCAHTAIRTASCRTIQLRGGGGKVADELSFSHTSSRTIREDKLGETCEKGWLLYLLPSKLRSGIIPESASRPLSSIETLLLHHITIIGLTRIRQSFALRILTISKCIPS